IKWRTHHEALELRFHHPVCAARTRQAKLITSMRAQPSPPGSTFGRLNSTRSASTSTFETSHPAGEARHRMVTVDPATAEKAAQLAFDDPANHIRSQSSPSATSRDRPSILPQKSDVSTLTQKLDQHHRTETDGVHNLRRCAREGFDMPDPSVRQQEFPFESRIALPEGVQPLPVRQQEFPFESRIALPEGVQPLPVRRAPERSPEPPRTA